MTWLQMSLTLLHASLLTSFLLSDVTWAGETQKNVLFLVVDDLRPEIGFYRDLAAGYTPIHPGIKTPNMDALAAESLVLAHAYTQYPVCGPSRASFMTSRRPQSTQVYDLETYWRTAGGNFTTIPQSFRERGYTSVGMGKIFHPGKSSGGDDPLSWSGDYDYYKPRNAGHYAVHNVSWRAVPGPEAEELTLPDVDVTRNAMTLLGEFQREGTPFFMAVGYVKPHLPFVFPDKYMTDYPWNDMTPADNNYPPYNYPPTGWSTYGELRRYHDIMNIRGLTGEIGTLMPDWKARQLRKGYYACVTYIDEQIGALLAELERLGLAEDTIVSLVSDHGFLLGEHSSWAKNNNFEEANRVPMMIRVPGLTDGGAVSTHMTELTDLFPTLVDLAGLDPLPVCQGAGAQEVTCTEGRSMVTLIDDGDAADWKDAAFSQKRHGATRMGISMRTNRFRYTEIVGFYDNRPIWDDVIAVELYDYYYDPAGDVNQAGNPEYLLEELELSIKLREEWNKAFPTSQSK